MMKAYVSYLQSRAKDYILDYGLGDWYDLGPAPPGEAQLTPKGITATSVYYLDLKIMEEVSALLGHKEDHQAYIRLAKKVKESFLRKYFNRETGVCSTGSQTAYAMPLYAGLIPGEYREIVFNNLADSIKSNDYALTSGDIGYHFLVHVLSEWGRADILYKMNERTDRPGYGYQLKKGATALTESWAALPTSSNDHMMLGHLMEWFYYGLGGIPQAEKSTGYKEIVIAPKPVGKVTWAKCTFMSPQGMISTDWKTTDGEFTMDFEVPEGSEATVVLPENYSRSIYVKNIRTGSKEAVNAGEGNFHVDAGKYTVEAKRNIRSTDRES